MHVGSRTVYEGYIPVDKKDKFSDSADADELPPRLPRSEVAVVRALDMNLVLGRKRHGGSQYLMMEAGT